jgi:hypothetical protein
MKKERTALASVGKKISNLYAFLLTVRWSVWLLGQIPQVEKAWAAFLQTPSGQALEVMLGSKPGWKAYVDLLLGPYGLLLFAAGWSIFWCANHFPIYWWVNLVNLIRSALQKPLGQKVANRFYLRVFLGNHEEIYDLKKPGSTVRVQIRGRDSVLSVSWEDGTPCLKRENEFICNLQEDRLISLNKNGKIVAHDEAFVTLQFMPFQAMLVNTKNKGGNVYDSDWVRR